MQGEMAAGTNEVTPKPLRILVALLACAALTTTPAHAAPATAEATFEQALLNVPPLPAEGDLDFEQADGGIKVKGEFRKGFTQADSNEYRLVAVDDVNKVIVDFTKEFAHAAEIAPPEVAEFSSRPRPRWRSPTSSTRRRWSTR